MVSSIKHQAQIPKPTQTEISGSSLTPKNKNRMIILTGSFIALLLITLGVLFIPKLIKPKEQLEKSIAVLPFRNLSNDTTQLFFLRWFYGRTS